jgi:hypothetical protein
LGFLLNKISKRQSFLYEKNSEHQKLLVKNTLQSNMKCFSLAELAVGYGDDEQELY